MRRMFTVLLFAVLITAQAGCLGTLIQTPTKKGISLSTTQLHIVALPTQIDATACPNGLSEVFTHVPLWGIVVGFFTLGIVVPTSTLYTCTAG